MSPTSPPPRAIPQAAERIWRFDAERPGPAVCLSFGVHGNERAPIDAGLELLEHLRSGRRRLAAGRLLLVHANPLATEQDRRWSEGGVDLNRCFHASVLAREPALAEEHRARAIAGALEAFDPEVLVDFHCTVEPGERFLMHHPPATEPAYRRVAELLAAETVLTDPRLTFGGVSLDEWASTRGRVGICYETGWIGDPLTSPRLVLGEMENVLAGLGLLEGPVRRHGAKRLLALDEVVGCEAEGFRWRAGVGENLQALAAGTVLGAYADGREVSLGRDAVLVFPKKRPELVRLGAPLVYLAFPVAASGPERSTQDPAEVPPASMRAMETVKVILRWPGRPASLEDVRRQYCLPLGVLDEAFGIQEEEDPSQGRFAVRVTAEHAAELEALVSSPGTVPLREEGQRSSARSLPS